MIWRSFFRQPAVTNEKAQPVRSLTAIQSIGQASEKLNCTKASMKLNCKTIKRPN